MTRLRGETEKRGLGSVFWGGRQYLFSNSLGEGDDRTRRTRVLIPERGGEKTAAAGEEEIAAAYRLLLDLQEAGAEIRQNVRGGADKVRRHDSELNQRLRALGYLQ